MGERNYYLVCFLDEYSRYIVYHELLAGMDGVTVSISAQAALETLPTDAEGNLFVVALKEPAKLMAVGRVVGRVEVENNLLRRHRMGFEEKARQQRFHLAQIGRDLLVTAVLVGPNRRH